MTHPDLEWPPTLEFWRGTAAGELRLPRCRSCARHQWYPRPRCPRCGGTTFDWHAVAPEGSIYSFTVVNRRFPGSPFEPPFAVLQITPVEAPESIVLANLRTETQVPLLSIGARVDLVFDQRTDGVNYPCALIRSTDERQGQV